MGMVIGIDASNLRAGGGITHLVELLRAAEPRDYGFSRVIVWGGRQTLAAIKDREWLLKSHQPLLDQGLFSRLFWQWFRLSGLCRQNGCDLLFVPGGAYSCDFRPIVTMSRNMLPFEWRELRRYGLSMTTTRLLLLRWLQSRSFRRASGLIFLTKYAQTEVMRVIKIAAGRVVTIPHGIHASFAQSPRQQQQIGYYTFERPYRVLYVSIIEVYKHQRHVAEAVAKLRASGLPVVLDLVGPASAAVLKDLLRSLREFDPDSRFLQYVGAVPHARLRGIYARADLNVFASSCENMPNILLEGMASGLPIACSHRGPMPEVLGDAGVYFDPENSDEIADALRTLLVDPGLRAACAASAYKKAQAFSWERCANQTFGFLRQVIEDFKEQH